MFPSRKNSHQAASQNSKTATAKEDTPLAPGLRPLSIRAKLGLTSLGFLLALLLFEIGFRIVEPKAHPVQSWSDRPKLLYLPGHGHLARDFAYSPIKPANTFRIIVVGDSFTFGGKGQFDDAFPKRLERMLNLHEGNPRVEVLNWGVPGYSTFHQIPVIKKALASYAPDLIISQVTLNDPEQKPYRVTHSYQNAEGGIVFSNGIFSLWHSLAYVFERIANTISRYEYKQYFFDLFEQDETWNLFARSHLQILNMTQAAQVPMLVVVFPLFSHRLDDRYPFAPLHEKIQALFNESKISSLDLLSRYRNIPPERLQAIPGVDSHPNEIAHRIAADAIYTRLVRQKLIPEGARIPKQMKVPRLT